MTLEVILGNRTVKGVRFDPGEALGTYKIYSLSLLTYFGEPVRLELFGPDIKYVAGPGTVVSKKADHLEIVSSTDDPYFIVDKSLAVHNPYLQFGVPLVFALLTFSLAQRVRPREFRFWRDLQEKKSSAGVNYQALNGMRGLAALLVLLDHAGVPGCDGMGMTGVMMFFCLSGFLLTIPFARDGARILNFFTVQDYLLRRVKRIAPMFYTMILAGYILNVRIEDAIRSALFLQGDSIYWTIIQETHFYLWLPLVILINHTLLRENKWLIVVFLFVLSYLLNNRVLSVYNVYAMGVPLTLLPGLFLGGVLACYIYHIEIINKSLIVERLCANHFLSVGLLATILLIHHLMAFAHGGVRLESNWVLVGNSNYLIDLLIFMLVMSERSCVARLLSSLPLRFLGLVSYSFYLLHPVFIKAVAYLSQAYLQNSLSNTTLGAMALVSTLLVATVTYTYIERPFILAGKGGADSGKDGLCRG